MIPRLLSRHAKAATVAVGALTAGLGVAGVVGAVTVAPHAAGHTALGASSAGVVRPSAGPYFVCVAYEQFGVCVGPPTT